MLHPALKYASVFLLSTVKFLGGPLAGTSMGLPFWGTMGLTVAGMMTSVFVFSGIGRMWIRHRQRQRRLRREPIFSRRSRNIIKVFKKFGMGGIAFLTPVLLSPIGGTVIATMLGVPRTPHTAAHAVERRVLGRDADAGQCPVRAPAAPVVMSYEL